MYLFLGQSTVVRQKEIIGIFDMDNTTVQKSTRDFLNTAEKRGEVKNVSPYDLPKTFVVCGSENKTAVYISPLATQTLTKRLNTSII